MTTTISEQLIRETAANLTHNEREFLTLCLNYDTVEGQLSDNYSNGGLQEAVRLMGGNKHAGAGLLSSLTKKGLGYCDDGSDWAVDPTDYHHTFWLSELGVRAAFAALSTGN